MAELSGFLTRLIDTVAHNHAVKAAAQALGADHAAHPAMRDVEARITRALSRLIGAAQSQGDLRADFTIDDLYLMFAAFSAGQPPAVRARWLALLLTGLTAR